MRSKIAAILAAIFVVALPALLIAQVPQFPQTLPPNTVVGRLNNGSGPSQAIPFNILRAALGSVTTTPVTVTRYVSGSGTITSAASLMRVQIVGGGGGGSGNNASNIIPTSQRGVRGDDTAFGQTAAYTPLISIASPAVVTISSHGFTADQPVYFTTNGALPTGVTANTTYWVIGSSITANTFQISTRPSYPFPGDVQPPVNTSGSQSGTHSLFAYVYVAQGGGGGGIIGDQGSPLSYKGCDSALGGTLSSYGMQGGAGGGVYGDNIGSGPGGNGAFGGGGGGALNDNGIAGTNQTGGGGGGAGATTTSSGGTGGASGSFCEMWLRPNLITLKYFVGAGGAGGTAGASTATVTIASPAVVTLNAHGFGANAAIKFTTTGALPTGLTVGTQYFVVGSSITANTFQVSAAAGGVAINTSGTQSGVHTVTSGFLGGAGGSGQIVTTEFFGLN